MDAIFSLLKINHRAVFLYSTKINRPLSIHDSKYYNNNNDVCSLVYLLWWFILILKVQCVGVRGFFICRIW